MIPASLADALADRIDRDLAPPAMPLRPLTIAGERVGWLDDVRAQRIAAFGAMFVVNDAGVSMLDHFDTAAARERAFETVVRALAAEGSLTAWRDERYGVATSNGAPLLTIERAAARYFGIRTDAVHVNGVCRAGGELRMWLARRSASKAIDPNLLDNLVGGGVAAGRSLRETLVKEAFEEAGLEEALSSRAVEAGALSIFRAQPDGIQDETLHVHDLALPPGWVPSNQDGEATEFRLVTPEQAAFYASALETRETATADASLVIADWLLREGQIAAETRADRILRRCIRAAVGPAPPAADRSRTSAAPH